jgi:hypothetical protein
MWKRQRVPDGITTSSSIGRFSVDLSAFPPFARFLPTAIALVKAADLSRQISVSQKMLNRRLMMP